MHKHATVSMVQEDDDNLFKHKLFCSNSYSKKHFPPVTKEKRDEVVVVDVAEAA